jgi:hypothetical protein
MDCQDANLNGSRADWTIRLPDKETIEEKYDFFFMRLQASFKDEQIHIMIDDLKYMGLFDAGLSMSEINDLSEELCNFWDAKVWNEHVSFAFQTLLITRPELEGVKTVFREHPAFSDLLDLSDGKKYIPFSFSVGKEKEDESPRNNDIQVVINGTSDDELIITPKRPSLDVAFNAKREYQIYPHIATDREEIDFTPIKRSHVGILYVLQLDNSGEPIKTGCAFDLIRAVQTEEACIVRIFSQKWTKEIYVPPRVWINVSEKMLPTEALLFPISISIFPMSPACGIESIKIKGVYLTSDERRKNAMYIASGLFQPYDYGFSQII